MTAPSPGILTRFIINLHYPTEDAYVAALADVLKVEYRAIVEAGFVLQIDAPDLGSARNNQYRDLTDDEFRTKIAERNIAVLNAALEGLPADRIRLHICWGNYEGPHTHDLPVTKIIDIAFKAQLQAISIEAANPRHDHEWEDLKTIKIPDDKILIPGVIDSTTNFVEHPRLVAQRIGRYADLVGRERVIAGVDCGFGTAVRDRADGRRQHRLGETARAQRRRGDREQAAVGRQGGVRSTVMIRIAIARKAVALQNFLSRCDRINMANCSRRCRRPCDHGEAVDGLDRELRAEFDDL